MAKKRKTELDIDIVEEEEEEEKEEEEESPPPEAEGEGEGEAKEKKSFFQPSILKITAIVIVLLLVLSGVGYGIYSYFAEKARLEEKELKRQEELRIKEGLAAKITRVPTVRLDRFFLPLRDKGEEKKFLSIVISLEMTSEAAEKEIARILTSIREAIFFYLSQKSFVNVSGKKKMDIIRKDVKILVSRNLKSGAVKNVFFLEYLIQ